MMTTQLGTLMTAAALCVVLGSNVAQLRTAHAALETVVAEQRVALAKAARVETQLDALAKGTQRLASAGNPGAAKIVAILQANGVRINDK